MYICEPSHALICASRTRKGRAQGDVSSLGMPLSLIKLKAILSLISIFIDTSNEREIHLHH